MMEQIIAIVKTLSVSYYFDLLKNEIGAITFLFLFIIRLVFRCL